MGLVWIMVVLAVVFIAGGDNAVSRTAAPQTPALDQLARSGTRAARRGTEQGRAGKRG